MKMQRKLDEVIEYQLLVRVDLSRATHIFSLGKLAEGFNISEMTLHRYASPTFRALSNRVALRRYYATKGTEQRSLIECHRCGVSTYKHKRCADCTIMIHGSEAKQGYCDSCFDREGAGTVSTYEDFKEKQQRRINAAQDQSPTGTTVV